MRLLRKDSERIVAHGGIFIVFAEARLPGDYVGAEIDSRGSVHIEEDLDWDNWGLLDDLDRLNVTDYYGVEIEPAETELARLVPLCPPSSGRRGALHSCPTLMASKALAHVSHEQVR
jgi:hypothetical protein